MAMISPRQTSEILCSRPVYELSAWQILRTFSVDYSPYPLIHKISSVIHGTERFRVRFRLSLQPWPLSSNPPPALAPNAAAAAKPSNAESYVSASPPPTPSGEAK